MSASPLLTASGTKLELLAWQQAAACAEEQGLFDPDGVRNASGGERLLVLRVAAILLFGPGIDANDRGIIQAGDHLFGGNEDFRTKGGLE
ncbi:MAG: hypothetical protein R3C97_14180 [Geminicoccaceae bacterium]